MALGAPVLCGEVRSIPDNAAGLIAAATREAAQLVADRFLLPDDAARLLKQIVDDMQKSQLLALR